MRYTGEGSVNITATLKVNLDVSGYDLDDAYGPASDDLEGIVDEIKIGLEDLVKFYNEAASNYGASTIGNMNLVVDSEIVYLDNSCAIDAAYDSWRDEEMMKGLED